LGKVRSGKNDASWCTAETQIWMCYFLRLYNSEAVNGMSIGSVDEKTFWKWTRIFIEATSYLKFPVVRVLENDNVAVQYLFNTI
jgi:hypothetical protein